MQFMTVASMPNIHAVHDCGQHADLVGFDPVDLIAGTSAPDIAASGHDTDLMSRVVQLLDLGRDPCDHLFIVQLHSTLCIAHCAVVFTGQCFTGKFQNDSAHKILSSSLITRLYKYII